MFKGSESNSYLLLSRIIVWLPIDFDSSWNSGPNLCKKGWSGRRSGCPINWAIVENRQRQSLSPRDVADLQVCRFQEGKRGGNKKANYEFQYIFWQKIATRHAVELLVYSLARKTKSAVRDRKARTIRPPGWLSLSAGYSGETLLTLIPLLFALLI